MGAFFMSKYDKKLKIEVAQVYLSGRVGARTLAAQYGLDHGTVRQWADRYRKHGEAGLSKKFGSYSAEFKLSVLRQMQQEDLSCRQAAALFDVRGGHGVISTWERLYDEGGLDALRSKPRGRPKMMKVPKPPQPVLEQNEDTRTLEQLRQENEFLRAEVAYLKKLKALVQAKKQAAQKKRD